ncbi:MAG: U32 family peptidase [Gammaproteobacteria bacterium]|nr:U32 family peptidase [Gammaproteobacteria bacterium]
MRDAVKNTTTCIRLALGPVPYYWPPDRLLEFYRLAATWPLDIVYLGETVCAKRRSLRPKQWRDLAAMLEEAGKQAVLSTLALLEAESELGTMRRLCANGRFCVEANDMAAVQMLSELKLAFVTGPGVNIYNPQTLALLARVGLQRWVPPVELSSRSLADMQHSRPPGVATEVFAYGRLPLAWSARCFTARAHGVGKDECEFRCLDDPQGRLIRTREGQPFLNLNGIQIESARTFSLLDQMPKVMDLGIDVLRITPQAEHTAEVVAAFHRARSAPGTPPTADALDAYMPEGRCNGYWLGAPGMALRPG